MGFLKVHWRHNGLAAGRGGSWRVMAGNGESPVRLGDDCRDPCFEVLCALGRWAPLGRLVVATLSLARASGTQPDSSAAPLLRRAAAVGAPRCRRRALSALRGCRCSFSRSCRRGYCSRVASAVARTVRDAARAVAQAARAAAQAARAAAQAACNDNGDAPTV
jgi:hypothetical protein